MCNKIIFIKFLLLIKLFVIYFYIITLNKIYIFIHIYTYTYKFLIISMFQKYYNKIINNSKNFNHKGKKKFICYIVYIYLLYLLLIKYDIF